MIRIQTNKDVDFVKQMRTAIKDNDGYCPCEVEKTADTRCMCRRFREQTTPGFCHCGLYEKVDD